MSTFAKPKYTKVKDLKKTTDKHIESLLVHATLLCLHKVAKKDMFSKLVNIMSKSEFLKGIDITVGQLQVIIDETCSRTDYLKII